MDRREYDRICGECYTSDFAKWHTEDYFSFEEIEEYLAMYKADLCTIPSNLAGNCAISVPCGLADGLPVGFQVMAPALADDRLYRVGAALEAELTAAWGGSMLDQLLGSPAGAYLEGAAR